MNRREALAALSALAAAIHPLGGFARALPTPARIAFLGVLPASSASSLLSLFRKGLTSEGFAQERDYTIDYLAEPQIDRVTAKVAELLNRKPALLVAITTPVAQAAAGATREVPIVFGIVSDPVGSGLVASLARPGGNVTGVSNMLPALSGKLLELMRELMPGISRAAVLWNPDNPAKAIEAEELRAASRKLGISLEELPVRSLKEIELALAPRAKSAPRALVILAETLTDAHRKRISELADAARMAVVSNYAPHTLAGGVLSYQPDYATLNVRLGALAGKILKGTKPAELPVELPTKFELLINAKAAKTLGLKVPQSLLVRADRVIE